MELPVGARLAVTEGEGVVTELHKLEEETSFGKYANVAQAGMGRERARPAGEKGKGSVAGRAERPGGPAGQWADWAECEGKFFSE
jgi:hypothetical protein